MFWEDFFFISAFSEEAACTGPEAHRTWVGGRTRHWAPERSRLVTVPTIGLSRCSSPGLGVLPPRIRLSVPGVLGMPRRIYTYEPGRGWDTLNFIITIGAFIAGLEPSWQNPPVHLQKRGAASSRAVFRSTVHTGQERLLCVAGPSTFCWGGSE